MRIGPDRLSPVQTATLIWYDASERRPDGVAAYQVAGPVLERVPEWPCFLLAPVEEGAFADRLYRGEVGLAELRTFLGRCVLALGWMTPELDCVYARAEAEPLGLLDAESLPERPVLPYLADIDAFLHEGLPVFVSPEALAAARREPECCALASVCAACGEADDASVFLWTRHVGGQVRVVLLIQNEDGRWTCRLYPFDFERDPDHG